MTYTAKDQKQMRTEKGSLMEKLTTEFGLIDDEIGFMNTGSTVSTFTKGVAVTLPAAVTALNIDAGTTDHTGANIITADVDVNSANCKFINADIDVGTALSTGENVYGVYIDIDGAGGDHGASGMTAFYATSANTTGGVNTGVTLAGTWDTGISISAATTTAISITGDATTGISITSGMSATNVISIAATASTAGINISGNCTSGITIGAQTTTCLSFTGGAVTLINADAAAARGSTRGIFIGEDSNSAQSGIPLLGAAWATSQGNALYCDDDGVALVGYTECFTARMLTTATVSSGDVSTTAIHSDLYLNASYTGTGGLSSLWGNTTIASTKSIDVSGSLGDVGGGTFGLDVSGTLAASSHGCGVSVGLGGSGTNSGIITGFRIRTPTGTVLWNGFASIPSDGTTLASMTQAAASQTATMTNAPAAGNPTYWLKVYVGTTAFCVPLFPTS